MACSPSRRDQIADFGQGRLASDAAGELLEHIATCTACSDEFDLVADLLRARAAIGAGQTATLSRAPLLSFRQLWPLVAAAAVLLTALLVWQPWHDSKSTRQLASLTPLTAPASLLRGDPGERGAEFARGMAAYSQGDYATAKTALRVVCGQRPRDALAQLYLGIAELQGQEVQNAVPPLAAAAAHGTGLVKERALWYLANAHVHATRIAAARVVLEQLRAIDGDYRINAEQLLAQLAGH